MTEKGNDFVDAARAVADERYAGRFERGFAHLALQVAFPTYSFSEDQAEEITAIDRKGDLGVDGIHIDEDEQQVLMFQSKSSASLNDPELHSHISDFISTPGKLLSDEWVKKAHSEMQALPTSFG